ncbi:MAG TPA: agmatine deiminase family protein [Vicinamibacteria bacterium]|nr:agmatine deiminase family protein [Vicinamibacteria bacterium]
MTVVAPLVALFLASSPELAPAKVSKETKAVLGLYPEFLESGALVLGFSELIQRHPQTLVDVVTALGGQIPIVGVVANEAQYRDVEALLRKAEAPAANLAIVQVPVVGMWIRDYGPAFVRLPDDRFVALDAIYGRQEHAADEWIPRYLAGYFRLPIVDVPLRVAGGNLLANGEGWVFSTTQLIDFNSKDGYSQTEIGQILGRYYGATDWVVLKPLVGEPTQHVDMFLTLVGPDVAVLSELDPEVDPVNSRLLDDAAEQLEKATTRSGPIKVVRVPMSSHEDGNWRSYTNVIFANGTMLVPTYPDVSPEMDREALEIYGGLMPDWNVVPIDASSIIQNHGSLHCISVNVPVLGR